MRKTFVGAGIAAGLASLAAVAVFGFGSPRLLADGCNYRGNENALPTGTVPGLPVVGALPVLVYGNADTTPAGVLGVSQGSALTYAQVSGSATGGQVEANASPAGERIWVNTDGSMGSC